MIEILKNLKYIDSPLHVTEKVRERTKTDRRRRMFCLIACAEEAGFSFYRHHSSAVNIIIVIIILPSTCQATTPMYSSFKPYSVYLKLRPFAFVIRPCENIRRIRKFTFEELVILLMIIILSQSVRLSFYSTISFWIKGFVKCV